MAQNYLRSTSVSTHGAVMSHRGNYLDLDPTYRDVYGRPLMRMTFDFTDNEHRMSDYLTDRAVEIAKAMKPREIKVNRREGQLERGALPDHAQHRRRDHGHRPDAPASVNRYLQSWDVPNLFVIGASAFPQNPGYNPTGTVGALAYWSAAGHHVALSEVAGAAGVKEAADAQAPVADPWPPWPRCSRWPRRAVVWANPSRAAGAAARRARHRQAPALIERGRYLAALGDCVACHTRRRAASPSPAGGRCRRLSARCCLPT